MNSKSIKQANHLTFKDAPIKINYSNGDLNGKQVLKSIKKINQLAQIFNDKDAFSLKNQEEIIYEVMAYFPVDKEKKGGLFYGKTRIYPGKVGNEYYMTMGHFHEKPDRGEFYWGINGEGLLLLMDRKRNTWIEKMHPGTLHYISGNLAHRVINVGDTQLDFGACWPSDAGYDYQEILDNGFSVRIFEKNGIPELVNYKK